MRISFWGGTGTVTGSKYLVESGATTIKIHRHLVEVHAEVRQLSSASAHADANELLNWMRGLGWTPKAAFVTHGEPASADALRQRIERELGWACEVPEYLESIDLAASSR